MSQNDDLISRQAAIDSLLDAYPDNMDVEFILGKLPSVQPEHGHWECGDYLYENAICSCCKWDSGEPWEYAWANFNFCPNCGADMKCSENPNS